MTNEKIKFKFVTCGESWEECIILPSMCSWDIIVKKLAEKFPDVELTCSMFLMHGDNQYFGSGISDSFSFWKMYDSAYSPEDDCIFAVVNDTLVMVRFFLNFNLELHAVVDLITNCSWDDITKAVSAKFSQLSPECIEGISVMSPTTCVDNGTIARDQKTFWDLVWLHNSDNSIMSMLIHGCRAYEFNCELQISRSVRACVKIPEKATWMEVQVIMAASFHLVAGQEVTNMEVIDRDGDSIGGICESLSDLWRRFSKGLEVDPNTVVLVYTEEAVGIGPAHLTDWWYDGRTRGVRGHKYDFRGTSISHYA